MLPAGAKRLGFLADLGYNTCVGSSLCASTNHPQFHTGKVHSSRRFAVPNPLSTFKIQPSPSAFVGLPFPMPLASRNTSNSPSFQLTHVEEFISSCPDRYFVTFTTKRPLDQLTFEAEVAKAMHRVNGALFGTAYRRGQKMFLGTMATQERTFYDGLHTHMLVGVPEGSLRLKANPCPVAVPDLLVATWIAGDPQHRRANGQDARDVYDFSGVRRYIYKGVRTLADFDNVDLRNTIIPSL